MRILRCFTSLLVVTACILRVSVASADPAVVGKSAPAFTVKNATGQDVSLAKFAGKIVVLEWFNPGCPFVKKFYEHSDMHRFQTSAASKGVVWLTISSSAAGRPGYIDPKEAVTIAQQHGIEPSQLLLDPHGEIGKAYGARTTPHMFVIDPKGVLSYAGAIDNTPSTHSDDIPSATNFVLSAIDALGEGKAPSPASTESYGCSVKYES